ANAAIADLDKVKRMKKAIKNRFFLLFAPTYILRKNRKEKKYPLTFGSKNPPSNLGKKYPIPWGNGFIKYQTSHDSA
ncbi:MAG: hypothetical protein WBM53_07645, partial [Maribacter sp.]